MGFYRRHILPRLIDCSCGMARVAEQRRRIVPQASGRVLDVGTGGGLNLALFDPARVSEVVGIDPDPGLLRFAHKRAAHLPYPVHLLPIAAEDSSLGEAAFDTIVLAYTLCSIARTEAALSNLRRALKPGGTLLFCEHGVAPDPGVRRWQRRIEPLWLRLAGGCHLTRDTVGLLESAGFRVDALDRFYMPGAPRFAGYHSIGTAHAH